jgi:hypothetical protein
MSSKEEKRSAKRFILEHGFAVDVPGHSLVLTPDGNGFLAGLSSLKAGIENTKSRPKQLGLRNRKRSEE